MALCPRNTYGSKSTYAMICVVVLPNNIRTFSHYIRMLRLASHLVHSIHGWTPDGRANTITRRICAPIGGVSNVQYTRA